MYYTVRNSNYFDHDNEANILKGNKPIVNFALLGPRQLILNFYGQTCAALFLIVFMFFYNQLKIGNRSNRVFLKNTSEKQIKHAFHAFQQKWSWSSNYLLGYNFFDMNK